MGICHTKTTNWLQEVKEHELKLTGKTSEAMSAARSPTCPVNEDTQYILKVRNVMYRQRTENV